MLSYERKYPDKNPEIPYAGKLFHAGTTVEDCLRIIQPVPADAGKRFQLDTTHPLGATKDLHFSGDPTSSMLKSAHGIKSLPSDTVADCVFPPHKTYFQERQTEIIEENLGSKSRKRKFPLGRAADFESPQNTDPINTCFGAPLRRQVTMEMLINPTVSKDEYKVMYQVNDSASHSRCEGDVGTVSTNRKYNERFDPSARFGTPPCPPKPDSLHRLFLKTDPNLKDCVLPTVLQDYYDKVHQKLGECTLIETKNLDPEMRFGMVNYRNSTAKRDMDILSYVKKRYRELFRDTYNQLKNANFNRFDQLFALCKYFDKSNSGWISYLDLKSACESVDLPIDTQQLNDLLDASTHLRSSLNTINYADFVNVLNYTFPFPAEKEPEPALIGNVQLKEPCSQELESGKEKPAKKDMSDKLLMPTEELVKEYVTSPIEARIVKDGDVGHHHEGSLKPGDFRRKPALCIKAVDSDTIEKKPHDQFAINYPPMEEIKCEQLIRHYDKTPTIASDIGALSFHDHTEDWCTFGNGSILPDHPPPRLQALGDHTNFGNKYDAYHLLSPSILTNYNVEKEDLLKPRTREEILEIFTKIGLQIDEDAFDRVWNIAACSCIDNFVSIETFRNILDQEMAAAKKFTLD